MLKLIEAVFHALAAVVTRHSPYFNLTHCHNVMKLFSFYLFFRICSPTAAALSFEMHKRIFECEQNYTQ
jgi:hypothetical protein